MMYDNKSIDKEKEAKIRMKQASPIRKIGWIVLLIGICAFAIGVISLALAASTIGFWIVVGSVLFNITGISLLTHKTY